MEERLVFIDCRLEQRDPDHCDGYLWPAGFIQSRMAGHPRRLTAPQKRKSYVSEDSHDAGRYLERSSHHRARETTRKAHAEQLDLAPCRRWMGSQDFWPRRGQPRDRGRYCLLEKCPRRVLVRGGSYGG